MEAARDLEEVVGVKGAGATLATGPIMRLNRPGLESRGKLVRKRAKAELRTTVLSDPGQEMRAYVRLYAHMCVYEICEVNAEEPVHSYSPKRVREKDT